MRYIALFITILAAACAATPDEVRKGSPSVLSSTSPVDPPKTALCLQRYWESQNGEINGQLVTLGNGALELQIRQQDFGVIALYDLQPASLGRTAVRMWWRDPYVTRPGERSLDVLLGRCR